MGFTSLVDHSRLQNVSTGTEMVDVVNLLQDLPSSTFQCPKLPLRC